jgi:hypothetical protein
VLSQSLTKYLAEEVGTIVLTPSLLTGEAPLGLTVAHAGLAAPFFSVAGNVLSRQGGSSNQIGGFCQDSHFAVSLSADAIHRIYDYWWSQQEIPRIVHKEISKTFKFSFLPDFIDTIDNWISEFALGGLVSEDIDVTGIKVGLSATLAFSKFSFDMKANNRIEVSGGVLLRLTGDINLIGTAKTRIVVYTREDEFTKNIFHFDSLAIPLVITSATAELGLDPKNRLAAKITEVHADIALPVIKVPDFVTDFIRDKILTFIAEFVGSFPLSPAIFIENIPGTDLSLQVKVNSFKSNQQEAIVGITTKTLGVKEYAPYVCNKEKKHMEVHKSSCRYVQKTLPKNRVYYCDLQEAFDDGFDGCYYCLNEYHSR